MIKKKILLVFGTRPEAIKMAPLVKELEKKPEQFDIKVCVTGQHREMLDQVLQLFEIKPDYDLNIMKAQQDLYDVTCSVLLGMRDIIKNFSPDLVLVHGDTSTATASAMAAFYQQIAIGHVEAGLRTWDIYSPWPEEVNRQIVTRVAKCHFAPTQLSKHNLIKEGIKEDNICISGNTVIDALYWVLDKFENDLSLRGIVTDQLLANGLPKDKLDLWFKNHYVGKLEKPERFRKMVLITGHRRENFGVGFLNICKAIKKLAEVYPNTDFVYPMHLNPNVRKAIESVFGNLRQINSNSTYSNIFFIEPLEYLQFVALMSCSHLVLTDSGGIQEEAPGLGKPVLVMRDTTERPEAVDAGTVKLVGTNYELIVKEVSNLLDNDDYYRSMALANNPYGDGNACKRIVNFILNC